MGMTKALMEKVMIAKSKKDKPDYTLWDKIWECDGFSWIRNTTIYRTD